ncbi:MAG: hypothetical protein H0X15_06820, partial [Acidobacteria bacterium]|nr:hypothetical protein [Acidobacteriota bacterium]
SELFEPLGIIRTEELLQARRLDGGEQFFTRVMDYGFSKKREEAARIWGEKETLGDMVRAIRLYRPLVIISRFTGTPADGHGQHQLAGYLTPIAFKAAADPKQFPEQLAEGLTVWQAKKLYVSQSFVQNTNNVPTLTINTGEYDSLIGRSYFEIAMEGRTQHKSQEMGLLELRGKQNSGLRLLESTTAKSEKETSVFDGVDISLAGIPKLVGLSGDFLNGELKDAQNAAAKALENYDVLNPAKTIAPLTEGLKAIREARGKIAEKSKQPLSASLADADFLLAQKEAEFSKALQTAAGVVVDALSDSETIVAGEKIGVSVRVFAPESTVAKVVNISLKTPQGWNSLAAPPPDVPTIGFRPRNENAFYASFFDVSAPPNAKLTEPYWLDKPRQNFNFDWSGEAAKNLPFQSPLVTSEVKIEVAGQELTITKPVQYRYADDIRGEIRRDLNVVPKVAVGLESDLLVAPVSIKAQKRRLVITVTNNSPNAVSGTARFNTPAGWTLSPNSAEFSLAKKDEKTTLAFDVTIPPNVKSGDYKLTANALVDGQTYDQQMQEIAYPHIQTHRIFSRADVTAQVLDLKIAPVRVGYIMGSGDKVPEAIQRMSLTVTMLEGKDLSTGDLSKFDTIVVGVRASQTRPDFVANNSRLLDFVKNGGTLIVQYQQQEYVNQKLPPFPAKMDMVINGTQRISNVRVVDENAPVKILQPTNPVFNFPNKITSTDFANWVQERNLYNFSEFDAKYTPLLESHDEGEPENGGGMVYAEIGRGKYVYSSYSWFRQLPRGVPGAYRIFANMLSLPKSKVK